MGITDWLAKGNGIHWASHIFHYWWPLCPLGSIASQIDSESQSLRNMFFFFFFLRHCLPDCIWTFRFILFSPQKRMPLKMTTVSEKKMKRTFSSTHSNWKQENKGSPLVRVVEQWAGPFRDGSTEYINREKPVCISSLLFARPVMDIVSFYPDKKGCVPTSWMRNVKPREVDKLVQGHSGRSMIVWLQDSYFFYYTEVSQTFNWKAQVYKSN